MLVDMFKVLIGFGLPVNTDYMSEVLGEVYEMDGNKLFTKTQPQPQMEGDVSGNAQGATPDSSNITPNVSASLQASTEKISNIKTMEKLSNVFYKINNDEYKDLFDKIIAHREDLYNFSTNIGEELIEKNDWRVII